jgi:glycosyltransferase involved in cell wall biosynthesis
LFPFSKDDIRGIFILDYIGSINKNFIVTVFSSRLVAKNTGFSIEHAEGYDLYRYALLKCARSGFLKPFFYLFWFIRSYKFVCKIKDIDLIHAHGTILSGTIAWLYSVRRKVPFIITEHQGPFSVISGNRILRTWAKFVMERAAAVLTVSNHLKNEILASGINPVRIEVTHNPVNTYLFNTFKRTNSPEKNFIFAGRLDSFKGAFRTLAAFSAIADKYPGWNYIIIGEGEDRKEIDRYLDSTPDLKRSVKLMGYMGKDEISGMLKSASFFVFPSQHESFGLVLAEAMACGLPVIGPNCTAPPEFIDERSGILVNPTDIDEISSALEFMINNHTTYNREEISGRITEKFGIKEFGLRMANIYRTLLA